MSDPGSDTKSISPQACAMSDSSPPSNVSSDSASPPTPVAAGAMQAGSDVAMSHPHQIHINGVPIALPPHMRAHVIASNSPDTSPMMVGTPPGSQGSGGLESPPMQGGRTGKKHRHRHSSRRADGGPEHVQPATAEPQIHYGGRIRHSTGSAFAAPPVRAVSPPSPPIPLHRPTGGGGVSKRALAFHQNVITGPQPQYHNFTAEERELTRDGIMVVISIVRTSPAEDAGLKCGDIITQFGNLNRQTFNSITQIVPLIKNNPNQQLPITVLRKAKSGNGNGPVTYTALQLVATPARWNHGGVMGCVLNWWPIPQPMSSHAAALRANAAHNAVPPPFANGLAPQQYAFQSLPPGVMVGISSGSPHHQFAANARMTTASHDGGTNLLLTPPKGAPHLRAPAKLPSRNNLHQFLS